jgi:hypothetical protein
MTTAPARPLRPESLPASHVFASRRHPGDAGPAAVYARALTSPLSFTFLLLMLVGTASVLLGEDPLPWLTWAAPLAAVLASAFTLHRLRSAPAELLLVGDHAAVRSVWDVATNRPAYPETLIPPKRVRDGLDVGVGRDVLTLTRAEWPELERIHATLLELVPPVRQDAW